MLSGWSVIRPRLSPFKLPRTRLLDIEEPARVLGDRSRQGVVRLSSFHHSFQTHASAKQVCRKSRKFPLLDEKRMFVLITRNGLPWDGSAVAGGPGTNRPQAGPASNRADPAERIFVSERLEGVSEEKGHLHNPTNEEN